MDCKEMSLPTELTMATSVCSSIADDSGVHCDMGQSITEAEDLICDSNSDLLDKSTSSILPDVVLESEKPKCDSNGNLEPETTTADEIVHRRRCKKNQGKSMQKKRVSFHEDILNSGRIDDVHIERGFISYRGGESFADRFAPVVRNSWSASGDIRLGPRHVMSDLLSYGATDANTLFSPTNSTQNSESETSNESTPSAETPFKSFSCDYSGENSPEMMKKQYFSEGDVNKCQDKSPKRKIKSVLKNKHYVTTNVVEEFSKKQGKMQVLESLKSFYYTFKLGLSPTTSGFLEEPAAVEAAPLDAGNERTPITDDFVQVHLDEPINKYRQPNRKLLSLNVNPRKSREEDSSESADAPATERNFVLNGESTVYEHTGTSYCYVNDSFKTTFDTAREKFTPIPEESRSMCESMTISFRDERLDTSGDTTETRSQKEMQPKEKIPDKEILSHKTEHKLLSVKENNNLRHLASPRKQIVTKMNVDLSSSDLASECERNSNFDLDDINLAKQSLLCKFMRNLQKGKNIEKQLEANQFLQNKLEKWRVPLLYNSAQVGDAVVKSSRNLDKVINKEVLENRRISVRVMTSSQPSYYDSFEDDVALECCERLKLELSTNPGEHLLRLVRGRISETDDCSGSWVAVAALVTSYGIRIAARDVTRYVQLAVMTYNHINNIQLGPEGQYVVVTSTSSGGVKLVTGDASLTDRFVNSLMWAAAVVNLYPQWSHVSSSWDSLYYGEVCVAQENARDELCLTSIEGHLMYKVCSTNKWTAAFFKLSNGVLRWEGCSLPLERLEGARRVLSTRPHCFELALDKSLKHSLVLAAANDQEASDWLQALLQNAAFALEPATTATPRACSAANVRVTRDAVCLSRENGDLLTYGPHLALHAVRLPSDGGDWCQLEWSVCEAKSGGEMTLLFSCGSELDRFLETLDCAYKEAVDACASLPLSVCACGEGRRSAAAAAPCSCVGAFASAALKSAMDDLLPALID